MGNFRVQSCPKLKIIKESYVKPRNFHNESPKNQINLGLTDLFMLTMDTMQKGLLFNTKLSPNFLEKLENALHVSLVYFYPLAGRFATKKFYDEHACSFYLDCEAGSRARLIHAAVDCTVSDILSSVDVHPIVKSFFDLGDKSVNHDGHTRPLLSVQVTELHDGVFIGFTMNHCIADGTSLWHFISTLSEVFNQIKDDDENEGKSIFISRKPIFETLFPHKGYDPNFKLPYLEPEEFINRYDPGSLRVRIFHFSKQSIATLKAQANSECGLRNNISSFQALSAFMWRSITRARNLRPDDEIGCSIVINARTRLDPQLPPEYFRCFLTAAQCTSTVRDLLSNELGRAALLVNQCIKSHDEKAFKSLVKLFEEHPFVVQPGPRSAYYKPNGVTIGGSIRFDMYGPEFGLGKAVAVLAGYASKEDGKVTANPGRDGDGSVDLEVCLKPETMNALELDQEFMRFVSCV
ncbi:hypothetical protein RND81_14G238300 [Saponaria officinalis]|uniref:Uncharacterized protein n=1 Tax=Saponaria officinalis TaxID=3572 RepID=A0AAW1GRJ7_SAPOF